MHPAIVLALAFYGIFRGAWIYRNRNEIRTRFIPPTVLGTTLFLVGIILLITFIAHFL